MRRKLTFILGVIFLISCMTTLASAEVKMEFTANSDFGGVQGANGWLYEYSTDNGNTYKLMDVYRSGSWTVEKADGSGTTEPWGICASNWNLTRNDIILATTFYAPYSGIVKIGSANGLEAPGSADIQFRLTHNGVVIKDWETFEKGTTQWEYYNNLSPVEVKIGDKIRYEIRLTENTDSLKQCWHIPKVSYTTVYENEVSSVADMTKTSWDSEKDFSTVQASVGAWRYEYTTEDGTYALMEVNESNDLWFVPNEGGDVDWNMPWIKSSEKSTRNNSNAVISFIAPVSGEMNFKGTNDFTSNLTLNVMVDDKSVYTHSAGWLYEVSIGEVHKGQTVRVVYSTEQEAIRPWFNFELSYKTDTNTATFDVDSQDVILGETVDLQLTGWMKNDYVEEFSIQLENGEIGTVEQEDGIWKFTGNEVGTTTAWIVDGKGNKVDNMTIVVNGKPSMKVQSVNIIKEGSLVKAEAELLKYGDCPYDPVLFLAVYDNKGVLKDVTKMDFELSNEGANSCLTDAIEAADGDTLSAFLWDRTTFKPLYTRVSDAYTE